MKIKTMLFATVAASLLSACSSTEKVKANELTSNLPEWVLNPTIDNGLAASECVRSSGNMSVDSKLVAANARLALSQQIETRISGLDKTYLNRIDSNEETTTGSNFSSVSKQLTKQKLNGSRVVKSDIVKISGVEHFCSLITLTPNATKELFAAILETSKRSVNPTDEKFLYQEFKAQRAEQSLENELKRLKK
ncbi:LPP20 family lipoprotein [Thalassotalea sp. ND16A]|uniref:LPP20 family lipoprotein n=1 Tax=Thalassotalea sp. ND16A TaxID=1535422 RepID=UPI00051A68EA|nr:LPP20 family lipoprotein [Thalassotalea sp. ND16A]KGJ99066.1 hypothetical protein ND16A_0397 [Thalassotalea sp. ND16A]